MVGELGIAAAGWRADTRHAELRPPSAVPHDWPLRSASGIVDAGGISWHVQRLGSGTPLLLLHGTAASTHTWRDLMPLLAEQHEVVAIDLPGHGWTGRLPDGDMSLPALARAIAALLQALDFAPRCVVGHSAGAAIALRMTLDEAIRPNCVVGLNAALLPFGGAMRWLFAPLAQFFAGTRLMPRLVAHRARDVRAVQRVLDGTGSNIDARGVELYQRLLRRESHVGSVLMMMASWELEPLLQGLPELQPRLLLVTGDQDKAVSPRQADAVAGSLRNASVVHLDACGHLAHEEQPARVAGLILSACGAPEADRHDVD